MPLPDQAMWVCCDNNLRITEVSESMAQKMGTSAVDLVGRNLCDLVTAAPSSEIAVQLQIGEGEPVPVHICNTMPTTNPPLNLIEEPDAEATAARLTQSVRAAERFLNHDILGPLMMSRGALELASEAVDEDTRELLEIVMARLERIGGDVESYAQIRFAALPHAHPTTGDFRAAAQRALSSHFEAASFTTYIDACPSVPTETLQAALSLVLERCDASKIARHANVRLSADQLEIRLILAEGATPNAFRADGKTRTTTEAFQEEWACSLLLRHGIALNVTWHTEE